jgi:cell fate regulator YaaT (PSP1 superfamily)
VRKASKKDEENREKFAAKRPEAMALAEEKIRARELDMKLIDCEYTFDGSKIIFYFTAEGRVDFRDLVRDLAQAFHVRIELRQVGIRDEAKLLGGLAPCGRPCCCASFLQDFKKVSIKMAKTQGLSLNPGKISGLCGRLMCCLEYENEYYSDVYKKMPKIGSEVETPDGKGSVVSNNMLKLITRVKIVHADKSEVYRDYPVAELKWTKRDNGQKAEKDDDEEDFKELSD